MEQCLKSVEKSMEDIECEVFVVDNNSVDGSSNMVRSVFPWVNLIENSNNLGFAKANNQAIKMSKGQYILLLNPDTVVEKNTFKLITEYMDSRPDVGGLGVKMINGNGTFLAESKRGFPTPTAAFYKMSGLSKLFPKSKLFNHYHLGYLDKDSIHEVEVLSGACMLLQRKVLDMIGLLDETYFMYGEDIDLSYRIIKAGYKNVYYSDTTIIHYKGQSTQKGSLNYVLLFYTAMKIFAKKYFSTSHARTFLLFLNAAIYFRASLSMLYRILLKFLYPVFDILIIYLGYTVFAPLWGQYKYKISSYNFPENYYNVNVPLYVLVIIVTLFFSASYRKPVEIRKTLKFTTIGVLFTLCLFAMFPEHLRYSRAMFLVGSVWAVSVIPISRFLFQYLDKEKLAIRPIKKRSSILVGSKNECERVQDILLQAGESEKIVGFVSPQKTKDPYFLGTIDQMETILAIHKPDDIIFCEQDIEETIIINIMIAISGKNIECRIAPRQSHFIVGNNISNGLTNVYKLNNNSLLLTNNRLLKRGFDIMVAHALILMSPFLLLKFGKQITRVLKNCNEVILNRKTWVGYSEDGNSKNTQSLPNLKPCVLGIDYGVKNSEPETLKKLNSIYANNYSIFKDLRIILSNFNRLAF